MRGIADLGLFVLIYVYEGLNCASKQGDIDAVFTKGELAESILRHQCRVLRVRGPALVKDAMTVMAMVDRLVQYRMILEFINAGIG